MFKLITLTLCVFSLWVVPAQTRSRGLRIIGGDEARAAQFPFAAAIYKQTASGTYFCGGALISNQWVLTAGQCVDGAILFTIRLGSNSLSANDPNALRLATDTFLLHPQYNPDTLENDVGVIKFRLPITFTDYIKPIDVLATTKLPDYSPVITMGWGQVSDDIPSPACSLVKYSGWDEVAHTDLGVWAPLDLAQVFITRMRSCTILTGSAVVLLLLASFFALLGHCNSDNKTIIASGFFILGGLSLGTGLVVFASALSETLMEITQYHKEPPSGPVYDYRYGWCFFTAGAAFIMTNMAAVFSLTGYLNRFPSVDEMVREMVPGAERKLREHQRLSSEYLVRHAGPSQRPQYDAIPVADRPKYEAECGPLLNKTPPDVCTTNKCVEFAVADLNTSALMSGVIENYSGASLAGQTVPITVKNHAALPPNKYGTLPGTTLHQGFLGVSEIGSSSSNSSGGYCPKSKTLQHQRARKKCVKIETFQTPDFAEFGKRSSALSYSGSAV